MKKYLLLIFAAFIIPFTALADGKQHRKAPDAKMIKEFKEYKIKFLAQEMELNNEQTDKFADLYSKMMEEKQRNFKTLRNLENQLKENSSEKEYKEVSEKISETRMLDVRIDKEYDARFEKFLTQKQIYKMKEAEEKFRRKMHEMHRKKHSRQRNSKS